MPLPRAWIRRRKGCVEMVRSAVAFLIGVGAFVGEVRAAEDTCCDKDIACCGKGDKICGEDDKRSASMLPYYKFSARIPTCGYCETEVMGPCGAIAEPINAAFSLSTVLLGLLGVLRSKRTTMAFQFLFGLLTAYGGFAAAYHVTLDNGYYRMMDVSISILQSFIVIMLFHSLYLFHLKQKRPEKKRSLFWGIGVAAVIAFTMYPSAVHVAGESAASPWVAWLVFDLLWILIAFLLILIWRRRDRWPNTDADSPVFTLVWYAIGTCVLAYAGWSVDKFLCCKETTLLAYLSLHGWWHFFMGLSFYYMITLNRYFSAHEYGFVPRLDKLPKGASWGLSFVEWRSRRDAPPSR